MARLLHEGQTQKNPSLPFFLVSVSLQLGQVSIIEYLFQKSERYTWPD